MKTRIKTFETNSSSSHSLVISKNPLRDQKISGDVFEIIPGEYGWEFNTFYRPEEKASYIFTDAKNNEGLFEEGEIKNAVKAIEVYLDKSVNFDFSDDTDEDYYRNGYVDHQSSVCEGETMNGIFDKQDSEKYTFDIERMLDFIFSSDCKFNTGNDNG